MNVTITTAAATDPIRLDEAKTHLQVQHKRDDGYIRSLIKAATRTAENYTGRKFINTTLTVLLDAHESISPIHLPYSPLSSFTSMSYFNTDGTTTTVDSGYYYTNGTDPAYVVANDGGWSIYRAYKAIQIVYVAGYGATGASVPEDIRHAIKMIVADLYNNQESAKLETRTQLNANEVPYSAKALLEPYRILTY